MAYRWRNRLATAMIGTELQIFEEAGGVIFEF
jgi:hypothetical protein